jgi:regulator of protease activity HflC (stomatin/prohibitin superfamily)
MEKQMRAERDKRAQIIDAEGSKRAAILQAEGVQQKQINEAEGQKQAQILEAEGDAQARIRRAEGEAAAIRMVSEAIKGTNADPAKYLIAMKYLETLESMTSGKDNKVVYIPFEATGVLSSLGGIKQLLETGK